MARYNRSARRKLRKSKEQPYKKTMRRRKRVRKANPVTARFIVITG